MDVISIIIAAFWWLLSLIGLRKEPVTEQENQEQLEPTVIRGGIEHDTLRSRRHQTAASNTLPVASTSSATNEVDESDSDSDENGSEEGSDADGDAATDAAHETRQRHERAIEESLAKKGKSIKSIGKKKLASLRRKQQRKDYNEYMRQEQERQRKEREEYERQREIEEEEEKRIRREEENRKREEREKKELAELDLWKHTFRVEAQGTAEDEQTEQEKSLQDFISFIKESKVVELEDLAAHFQMKTTDAIDRIKTLQSEKQLTGILDDRGKFIYITPEEMADIAQFVTQRGRVSISQLAAECNRRIRLQSQ